MFFGLELPARTRQTRFCCKIANANIKSSGTNTICPNLSRFKPTTHTRSRTSARNSSIVKTRPIGTAPKRCRYSALHTRYQSQRTGSKKIWQTMEVLRFRHRTHFPLPPTHHRSKDQNRSNRPHSNRCPHPNTNRVYQN